MDNKTKTEIRAIIADAVAEKISQSDATEQIIGLSSPPPQGIEELKHAFYEKFGESSFRGYPLEQCHAIFNFFLPHLSNDAEVKELREEVRKLEGMIEDYKALNEDKRLEISDLKSKLEQQGVSDYIINDYLITLEKCHCVFDDMCLNRAVDMLEVNLLMNKIEVILNTNPPKTN